MKTADLPNDEVLAIVRTHNTGECLKDYDRWHNRSRYPDGRPIFDAPHWASVSDIEYGTVQEWPTKIVLAKMAKLIKRKLVDGCACGCRGDFVLMEFGGINAELRKRFGTDC